MELLTGEPLALDLVNTRARTPDGDVDFLETADGLAVWLSHQAERLTTPADEITGAWAAAVRRLRGHVDAAIASREPDAITALNEAARRAPSYLTLGPAGVTTRRDAPPLDRLLAELAEAAITLLGGPDAARIKSCEAPGCRMVFLPAHPRRRWCSPDLCGNRVRVARHYQRNKSGQR